MRLGCFGPATATNRATGAGSDAGGEETGGVEDDEEETKEPGDVDRMLFVQVTVYPPGYSEEAAETEDALRPRTAWTAIYLPPEEAQEEPR